MGSSGMKRCIDSMGRVVIPIEYRRSLDVSVNDAVDFRMEEDKLIITKHRSGCVFCGSEAELTPFKEKFVCRKCLAGLFGR